MELIVASAVAAVVAMIGWLWLFLYLFLFRVTAEIDAIRDSLVAKLDARGHRLSGRMQQLENRLESRMQRLEDRQNNLRVGLARLEGILIGSRLTGPSGASKLDVATCDNRRPMGERIGDPAGNPNRLRVLSCRHF